MRTKRVLFGIVKRAIFIHGTLLGMGYRGAMTSNNPAKKLISSYVSPEISIASFVGCYAENVDLCVCLLALFSEVRKCILKSRFWLTPLT